jgi:hypothetical protein
MLERLGPALSSLSGDAQLSTRAAVLDRLAVASTRCQTDRDVFTVVPAAVGVNDTTRTFQQSDLALLIGGGTPRGYPSTTHVVQQVHFPKWLKQSFTSEDHIVLKLDVEGAEHVILHDMLQDGSIGMVDILLWECHGGRTCAQLKAALQEKGVRAFSEPYNFGEIMRIHRKEGGGKRHDGRS